MSIISEESINAIREKTNLIDVVSEYVTLKKAGRSYKGLCPFHREKTPSFVVDAQKQLYHCFGCSEGGNVFNFLMKIENLNFADAVEQLAKKVGVSVNYASGGNNKRQQSLRERYHQINKEAASYYHYVLMKTEQGRNAKEYLKRRGYEEKTVEEFLLGFAPLKNNSLAGVLLKKGFKREELITLNLAYSAKGSLRDRFINRLMFPIEDARGNIIAFGGRALSKEAKAKYLNSAQTPLFNKSKQFYGLNLAKNEIVKNDQVILVEGYTDVISLNQAGFKNSVATLGTALTVFHLEILARFCTSAIMLFDSDNAGLKAAERSIEFANKTSLELLVAILPEDDPADFVLNKGREELNQVLEEAKPLVDFCLKQIILKGSLDTPKKRIETLNKSFSLIRSQNNAILEQQYLNKLAKLTGVDIQGLTVEYNKVKQSHTPEVIVDHTLSAEERAENLLLSILTERPDLIEKSKNFLEIKDFLDKGNKELYGILISSKIKDISLLIDEVKNINLRNRLSALCLADKPQEIEQAFAEVSKKVKDLSLKRDINKMKNILENTNPVDNREEYDTLFKRLINLEAKRRDLQKMPMGV